MVKKTAVFFVVMLLMSILMITASSGEEAPVRAEMNSNGYYEWNIRGVTLQTKTNIMDYIDSNNYWNSKRFAEDLGWTDPRHNEIETPMGYQLGNVTASFLRDGELINGKHDKWFCYGVEYSDHETFFILLKFNDIYQNKTLGEYYINNDLRGFTVSFDVIAYYTYICEQLTGNPSVNPLEEILGEPENKMYIIE